MVRHYRRKAAANRVAGVQRQALLGRLSLLWIVKGPRVRGIARQYYTEIRSRTIAIKIRYNRRNERVKKMNSFDQVQSDEINEPTAQDWIDSFQESMDFIDFFSDEIILDCQVEYLEKE